MSFKYMARSRYDACTRSPLAQALNQPFATYCTFAIFTTLPLACGSVASLTTVT